MPHLVDEVFAHPSNSGWRGYKHAYVMPGVFIATVMGLKMVYLLIVIGTPTAETSVTVIWNNWYNRLNACRSQGVSATR